MNGIDKTEEEIYRQEIQRGRDFMRNRTDGASYVTDQEKRLVQPPLTKKATVGCPQFGLPRDFDQLNLETDLIKTLYLRRSSRAYSDQPLTLLELSFLLWAQQGVKGIRGNNYATLRTVPCGGARHEFELYVLISNVDGLQNGAYHYLPMNHALELLHSEDELTESALSPQDLAGHTLAEKIVYSFSGQQWTKRAAAAFYYSIVPYRSEWRYGAGAHRVALIDSGHITENLYLASAAANLGTCAIAAVGTGYLNRVFGLDGDEEFIFYGATVGTIKSGDDKAEDAFYAFIQREPGAEIS